MDFVRGINQLQKTLKNAVVTIGNFDGVHLGHRKIIDLTIKKARERQGSAVAYTFRPHPQVALRPDTELQLLSTYDEKIELLRATGLDLVIEEPFSREFSTTPPEQFFQDVLLRRLNASEIIVGYDFAFGKGRQGHLETLEAFCKRDGVGLTVVPPQRTENEVVSSTRIRQHLLSGEIESATKLLGRPFSYQGVVIKGEQRGRKLGFPTANLQLERKLTLPYGVYATWAVSGGTVYPSVTNVGIRPSFTGPEGQELPALVETHLLDVTMDLYGSTLEVRFVQKLRDEMKFTGAGFMDALKAQIQKDADRSRKILSSSKI